MASENHGLGNILVVEDEATTRLIAETALGKAGFQVHTAEHGMQALEVLATAPIDLVMLDVTMPGIDGFETCRRIRALEGRDALPVLMVTGLDDVDSIEQSYAAGATDFATKPLNWSLIAHRLRYLLRASEALKRLGNAVDTIATSRRMLDEAERIASMGSWEWDAATGRLRTSQGLNALWGGELAQRAVSAGSVRLVDLIDQVAEDEQRILRETFEQVLASGTTQETVHWIRGADANRCVHHRIESVHNPRTQRTDLRATVQDITKQRQAEEKIRRLAYFDNLTGLANRESFKERLAVDVERVRRQGRPLAALLLALDDFKRINDTLGHGAGDELLRHVATSLQSSVRSKELVTWIRGIGTEGKVARLGGDEFAISLTDIVNREDAMRVAQRILSLLSEPIALSGHEVVVSSSVGIAMYPDDGQDGQALLENADKAMHVAKRAAKRAGTNLCRFYDASMNSTARRQLSMEAELRGAIDRNELSLHFQPQMDLRSGEIDTVEALLRWDSAAFGRVLAADFIPLAEESRLIIPIGEWVLRSACRQLRSWSESGLAINRIAVNISSVQFMQPNFVPLVAEALKESCLRGDQLELEITESLLARDVKLAATTLAELKALGVRLSIDDFGTGYSSLSQLKRLPVDRLKIDQSFVHDIVANASDAAIVMAVIAMASSMNLTVVAEGVETRAQVEFLRLRSCDKIQGTVLSPALPAADLEQMLGKHDASEHAAGKPPPDLSAVR